MSNNWKNWCRLCAKTNGNEIELYDNFDTITDLRFIIQTYFNIFLNPNDEKPTGLCRGCFQYILEFKQFCERCSKSDRFFSELVCGTINLTNIINTNELLAVKHQYGIEEKNIDINNGTLLFEYNTETNNLTTDDIDVKLESHDNSSGIGNISSNVIKTEDIKEIAFKHEDNLEEVKELHEENDLSFLEPHHNSNSDNDDIHETAEVSATTTLSCRRPKMKSDITEKSVKKKRNRNDDGIFKCEMCDKIFSKRSNYQYHLKAKHAGTKLFCSKCPKFFSTKSTLKSHEKVHLPDSEKMIHICTYCNKRFSKAVNVKTHIRTIHINEIGFICDECGKGYKTKAALQGHQLSHTDERPFACPNCPKRFKSLAMLHIHSDHHSDTTYPCPNCGVAFNTKKSLRFHMVVHTDEKKHKCNFCGNEYKRYKALKYHLISHTGFRHSCPYCDKTFANGTNCRNHQKTVHATEYAAAQLEIEKSKTDSLKI